MPPSGPDDVHPELVVIGAGAFGGWTALYLRELGHSVMLIDAYGPGNSRASSGGETRQIRAGYGNRVLYTRWAKEALVRWQARQEEWGTTLFVPTGRLVLSPEWTKSLADTKTVLDQEGIPNEVLQHDELASRYRQMNLDGIGWSLFEPTSGVLKARKACRAVAEAFQRKGGRLAIGRATLVWRKYRGPGIRICVWPLASQGIPDNPAEKDIRAATRRVLLWHPARRRAF
jgi:glycine/D-amino acid oxidase-like deaminating enzyme